MKERWFEAFRQDPHQAVSDLFTGRAGVGVDMRVDVPELLRQWFPRDLTNDRLHLDEALLWWLRQMRHDHGVVVKRIGCRAYGKRIGDALIALQLLDLPRARDAICRDLDDWLSWLSPLRLAPERDPALECYRLLTYGQLDTRHTARWLRLAEDVRPEYLTVALAGLRRLPTGGDARQNQVLMLQALLRRAVVCFKDAEDARGFFNGRFAAVRGLFPRAPDHWNAVLDCALTELDHVESPVAEDLAAHLREKRAASTVLASLPNSPRSIRVVVLRNLECDHGLAQLFNILEHRYYKRASAASDSHGTKQIRATIERVLTFSTKWFQSKGRHQLVRSNELASVAKSHAHIQWKLRKMNTEWWRTSPGVRERQVAELDDEQLLLGVER